MQQYLGRGQHFLNCAQQGRCFLSGKGRTGGNFKTNNNKPPANCETYGEEKIGCKMEMDFSKMESDAQRAHQTTLGMVASIINNIPICYSKHFSLKCLWKHQKGLKTVFARLQSIPETSHALCHHLGPHPLISLPGHPSPLWFSNKIIPE